MGKGWEMVSYRKEKTETLVRTQAYLCFIKKKGGKRFVVFGVVYLTSTDKEEI